MTSLRLHVAFAALLAALFAAPLASQTAGGRVWADLPDLPPGLCASEWSSPFGAEPGVGPDTGQFEIYDAVVYDDGLGGGPALYVGGDFTTAGGIPAPHLARWDGSTWSDVGGGVDGRVRALAVADFLSGPVLLVGGDFAQAGGVPATNLAIWDGTSWSAVGVGANDTVTSFHTLAGAPGSSDAVIVGGAFTSIGGVVASRIAIFTGTGFLPFGVGFDNQVLDVTEHDGEIYAGGIFDASGATPLANIARWNGAAWEDVDGGAPGGFSGSVARLQSFDDGSGSALYACGVFVVPGAFGSLGRWRSGVGWDAPGGGVGTSIALDLAVWDDGGGPDLYVAGLSMSAGGETQRRVLRWDGSAWSGLGAGFDTGIVRTLQAYDDGTGSELFACGAFWSVAGQAARGVARWDGAAWSATGGTGLAGGVTAMCSSLVNGAPALYVAGWADRLFAPGVPGTSGVLGWQDGAWFGVGDVIGINSARVLDLVAFDDGSGPALYAGGSFASIDGVLAANIARWNGSSWSAVGGGMNEIVTDLHVWDDGGGKALYAGGLFDTAGGVPAWGIAKWDGVSWSPLAGGLGPDTSVTVGQGTEVHAMQAYDDGSGEALYVAGRFGFGTWAPSAPGDGIARWDGAAWSAVGTGLGNLSSSGIGRSLAVYDDGGGERLFVGGDFDDAGGVAVQNFAAYDGAWHALPGGTFSASVDALAVYDNGSGAFLGSTLLGIGGRFSTVGGAAIARAAQWDGVAFTSLGGGLTGTPGHVAALVVHDLGEGAGPQLALGGDFSTVSGLLPQPASHLALLGGCWDGVNAWTDLGFALAGVSGDPSLVGSGSLAYGSLNTLALSNAKPGALAGLFLSFTSTPVPFAGGTLVPVPWLDPIILTLPPSGALPLDYLVESLLPPGVTLYVQWVIADSAATAGIAMSNAVVGLTP